MRPPRPLPALYAAFDVFPSPKGAATHIARAANALFDAAGGGLLCVLDDGTLPPWQREGAREILRHAPREAHYLDRAAGFSRFVAAAAAGAGPDLALAQFRDPWGGLPLLADARRRHRCVYEVNGLPSIELPERYPALAPRTLDKLRALERECLDRADAIVTPSATIARNLARLGADPARVHVVRNGADAPAADLAATTPSPLPGPYLVYVGALQPWQGLPVLLRAFARLADFPDLSLAIVSAASPRVARPLARLAARLGIAERVVWRHRLPRDEVAVWLAHAVASVAPLAATPRNLEQGCCPLKILESMAVGVPVVASDLPAVREIVRDGVDGRLVPADRPVELARALRVLLELPAERAALGERARRKVAESLTWAHADAALGRVYAGLREAPAAARA